MLKHFEGLKVTKNQWENPDFFCEFQIGHIEIGKAICHLGLMYSRGC